MHFRMIFCHGPASIRLGKFSDGFLIDRQVTKSQEGKSDQFSPKVTVRRLGNLLLLVDRERRDAWLLLRIGADSLGGRIHEQHVIFSCNSCDCSLFLL